MKKPVLFILSKIKEKLVSLELKETYKLIPNAFQRKRKLTITYYDKSIKKSLAIEIHNFFKYLSDKSFNLIPKATLSAFVQARKKISSVVFIALSNTLLDEFYTDNDQNIVLWNNLRLLTVDGTTVNLHCTKENVEKYGCAKNQKGKIAIQARSLVLYDLENKMVLDAVFVTRNIYEREMAKNHLKHTSIFLTKDIILLLLSIK